MYIFILENKVANMHIYSEYAYIIVVNMHIYIRESSSEMRACVWEGVRLGKRT